MTALDRVHDDLERLAASCASPRPVITTDNLTPAERRVYVAGYLNGHTDGLAAAYQDGYWHGRRDRMAEERASWQFMADWIKRAGGPFSFSRLAAQRGHHELAERARRNEDRIAADLPLDGAA